MGDDSEACAVVDGGFLYEMEFCGRVGVFLCKLNYVSSCGC